jgi:thioredoxin 1
MASQNVHEFTDANFDAEVLKSDVPVLVDFWAIWCGPCRMVAPIIDEIAGEMLGKIKVGKVDIDANMEIAQRYGIQSIPTLMIFSGGEPKETARGAMPKSNILQMIESAIHAG